MEHVAGAILLGVIQGATEWLPISSSGHLVLAKLLLGIEKSVQLDLVLHLGSLAAVLIALRKDIISLLAGIAQKKKSCIRKGVMLAIATVPVAVAGYFFAGTLEDNFHNPVLLGASFLFTGAVLMLSRYPIKKPRRMSPARAVIVGISQALALLPGVSRSGMTISAGLIQGINREDSVRFSFLLFIPAVSGALLLKAGEITAGLEPLPAAAGFAASLAASLVAISALLRVVRKKGLHPFGWYCLALGITVLAFSLY